MMDRSCSEELAELTFEFRLTAKELFSRLPELTPTIVLLSR
jgi:hypothetical protein